MNGIKVIKRHLDFLGNEKQITTAISEFMYADDAEIRIGVSIAEEEAKNESARRRINAPLTIEEKVFLYKNR